MTDFLGGGLHTYVDVDGHGMDGKRMKARRENSLIGLDWIESLHSLPAPAGLEHDLLNFSGGWEKKLTKR